jgi:hypothetical protein
MLPGFRTESLQKCDQFRVFSKQIRPMSFGYSHVKYDAIKVYMKCIISVQKRFCSNYYYRVSRTLLLICYVLICYIGICIHIHVYPLGYYFTQSFIFNVFWNALRRLLPRGSNHVLLWILVNIEIVRLNDCSVRSVSNFQTNWSTKMPNKQNVAFNHVAILYIYIVCIIYNICNIYERATWCLSFPLRWNTLFALSIWYRALFWHFINPNAIVFLYSLYSLYCNIIVLWCLRVSINARLFYFRVGDKQAD